MRAALDGWHDGLCVAGDKISNWRFPDDTTVINGK